MTIQSHQNLRPFTSSSAPFMTEAFLGPLEDSGVIGGQSGWDPHYFYDDNNNFSYLFAKSHSYGEYIFDWAWAQAFESYGKLYFPKLTSMIPFTSATAEHFSSRDSEVIFKHLDEHYSFYMKGDFSSLHYLFITGKEKELFQSRGFLIRESFQYHFFNNDFKSFEDFLSSFKSRKAKQVRKERLFSEEIVIERFTGDELTTDHAHEMWNFYISTIAYKNSRAYLNEEFFIKCFESMKDNILYVRATKYERAIAGSLFFFNDTTLYGRYWGCLAEVKNLHFELCYYQGIDFSIERNLKIFEAGAQGEHKIGRGFIPARTYSAHHIKDPMFRQAIGDFIEREKEAIAEHFDYLQTTLPYKA
jgi:predicted N-acyltransferase